MKKIQTYTCTYITHTYAHVFVYFYCLFKLIHSLLAVYYSYHVYICLSATKASIPGLFSSINDNLGQRLAKFFPKWNTLVSAFGLCQNFSTLSLQQESHYGWYTNTGVAVFTAAKTTKHNGLGPQAVVCWSRSSEFKSFLHPGTLLYVSLPYLSSCLSF